MLGAAKDEHTTDPVLDIVDLKVWVESTERLKDQRKPTAGSSATPSEVVTGVRILSTEPANLQESRHGTMAGFSRAYIPYP